MSTFSDFCTNPRMSKKVTINSSLLNFTTTPEAKEGRAAASITDYPINWRHTFFSITSLYANPAISNKKESLFRKHHTLN